MKSSLEEVKKLMVEDPAIDSCEEIITLDVQRSLYLHQNVISQSVDYFKFSIKKLLLKRP